MLEFTLGGFVFAIINFLILVALLYKFFHKPLLDVLEKRRNSIREAKESARKKAAEAETLKTDYEEKLAAIEDQRDEILAQAKEKVQTEKDEILKQARQQARNETENAAKEWQRKEREAAAALRERVLQVAAELAEKILAELADQRVEERLRKLTEETLDEMAERPERDRKGLISEETPVRVITAQEWAEKKQQSLVAKIQAVAGQEVPVEFVADQALVGGLRVEFVSEAIDASLRGMTGALMETLQQQQPKTDSKDESAQPGRKEET